VTDLFRSHLGDTPLSDEERRDLIPSLSTQRELNEFEFANIRSARDWARQPRRLAKADITSASYLIDLHRRMFNATWRWAGRFRTTEKTIGVSPVRLQSDLGALLGDARYWLEHREPIDETAVRMHHRLVYIHLFPNGNGLHARLVADLLVQKHNRPPLSWGSGTAATPVVRAAYLAALRQADQHDYGPLFTFARSGDLGS
jgi:Fic-DOC domain mobile mystery protein B